MASSLMIILLFLFTAPLICSPFKIYSQRQNGDLNVHAQLDNFIIVLVPTSGVNWVDITAKTKPYNNQGSSGDGNVFHLYNKTPSAGTSPYKVDIDESNVPLDKVSGDEPVENETIDPQMIQDDNIQQRTNIVTTGGNVHNNEVTKQTSLPGDYNSGSEQSDNDNGGPEKSISQQQGAETSWKYQETEDGGTKQDDSTGNKLAFSSTVSAHLGLLNPPEKKISAPVQQTPPPSAPNVIIGKAFKNARFLNTNGDEKKSMVKILQSGLQVCSPGQRLTPKGECVDIPSHRER